MFSLSILTIFIILSCQPQETSLNTNNFSTEKEITFTEIITGAERMHEYVPKLQGKQVALVVNQTSVVDGQHIVDSLLGLDINVKKIFSPEHGFRGNADAGEKVNDGIDTKTGLPLISLYGSKKKPSAEDLEGIEIIVFDIQDVGARFYTYISTLHYIMEACAEQNIKVIVLDRPNPNAHFVDGPVLEKEFKSFVGMHPVPVVYGMTIGEYALMINGESWLENGVKCDLTVVSCDNYAHSSFYSLPIKPSPNLPNDVSILLYPSLCFFEGTVVSVGRGTDFPFQQIGHPELINESHQFIPRSGPGSKYPKHENEICYGLDLSQVPTMELHSMSRLNLSYLINYYKELNEGLETFFLKNKFFNKLAGNDKLMNQIEMGLDEDAIRETWKADIEDFKKIRSQYLLYEE